MSSPGPLTILSSETRSPRQPPEHRRATDRVRMWRRLERRQRWGWLLRLVPRRDVKQAG